ncbi:MAG: sterol desaturase/sphingolipid hydroxylase (fatty acid hydroxylase superfamily) [Flavobacteriaceae bacterium]|jgi:sterol desaturase/sphingolipid hydroxylase (fatty acid hydroxylase superfamily)
MWSDYLEIFLSAYENIARYLWKTITHPFPSGKINGFYFLIAISLVIWMLEILIPWRKNQAKLRKDFWQDSFYMFFNFYLFGLLIYAALSSVSLQFFKDLLAPLGYEGGHLIDFSDVQWGWQLLIFFFIADFIQWVIHNLLHRVPFLWKFHKIHHSVKEMGFAAHLRYHFLETFVYQSMKYISLSMIFGFSLSNAFIVYSLTVLIGHLNHANLGWSYGPLKYLLNNPKMHIWHHAKDLPAAHAKGMNFGISLSCWDYIFGTAHIPSDGRDIELGFPGDETFPESFAEQAIEPFKSKSE